MSTHPDSKGVKIVLVEPADEKNVGMVARAMSNFGFAHLVVVTPFAIDRDGARRTACWGAEVIRNMLEVGTLEEALRSTRHVFGFRSSAGPGWPVQYALRDWVERPEFFQHHPLALVFGPERNGLTKAQASLCSALVTIPTVSSNPSLNLAQAVLVTLYEVTRGSLFLEGEYSPEERPTQEALYHLEQALFRIAERTEFFHKGTPPQMMTEFRTLMRRAALSKREADILLGLCQRIQVTLPGASNIRSGKD